MSLQLIQIFYENLIFFAENHVYKHCGDICNDVILMPQFLEVVQQQCWTNYDDDNAYMCRHTCPCEFTFLYQAYIHCLQCNHFNKISRE